MFKCPSCENEFEKIKPGGICPVCRAKLKREGDIYVLRDRLPEEVDNKYDLLFWDGVVKLQKKSNEDKYIMNFYNILTTAWINCPQCKAKLFQNQDARGSLEIKCKRCKAIITYIFESDH